MANETKEKCFIITPIGEDTDPIRRHIDGIIDAAIKPALSDKYEVLAAHHISKPGSITKQVIEAIYNAKLVIANLTGRNPNVMYELALRHAIGKPVIMIVEKGTPVPSDIIMQRVVPYSNDAKGVLELQADLKKAESEISFDEKSGPIMEVLGDISHDADMLQKVAAKNSDNMEPLEYIMRRLDRIESSINVRETVSSNPLSNIMLTFHCEAVDAKKDSRRIHSALSKLINDAGCEMTAFDVGNNKIYLGVRGSEDYLRGNLDIDICNLLEKMNIHVFSWRTKRT